MLIYTSLRSRRALTRLMVSAYSIYPELSPLESLVIVTLCFIFRFSISSQRNVEVASPSRFGFVAIIISSLLSEYCMRVKSFEKFKSPTNTQFIGDIAPHSTWYTPLYHHDCSRVSKSRYSSTTHIWVLSRFSFLQILHWVLPTSVIDQHISHELTFSLILIIFSLSSLR